MTWPADHADRFIERYRGARVCVTGGAGFIGGHLAEALVGLGATVIVIDDLSSSDTDVVAQLTEAAPDRVRFVHGSILDPSALREAVDRCDVVFHQAAIGSVPRSIEDPLRSFEVNALGTARVLDEARRAGAARVVNASSSSVYGGGASAPGTPVDEADTLNPRSPYAASKIAAEHALHGWCGAFGMSGVSLRYFNVFGPRQRADSAYAAVVPAFLAALTNGRPATIFGDGTFTRDFTPVRNAVYANLLAGAADKPLAGEAVNIGTGGSISIADLHRSLAELAGAPDAEHRSEPARAGDVPHSRASIGEAQRVLAYTPIVSATQGLRETAEWFGATPGARAGAPR